jgi:hypothetical protein
MENREGKAESIKQSLIEFKPIQPGSDASPLGDKYT